MCRAVTDLSFPSLTQTCVSQNGTSSPHPPRYSGNYRQPLRAACTIMEPCFPKQRTHTHSGQRSPLLHSMIFYQDPGEKIIVESPLSRCVGEARIIGPSFVRWVSVSMIPVQVPLDVKAKAWSVWPLTTSPSIDATLSSHFRKIHPQLLRKTNAAWGKEGDLCRCFGKLCGQMIPFSRGMQLEIILPCVCLFTGDLSSLLDQVSFKRLGSSFALCVRHLESVPDAH